MEPILTVRDKCRKCYSCVRSCPVKAIKVENDATAIIAERCIGCGNCLTGCPQKAKVVADQSDTVEQLLAGDRPVLAVLGCSFAAYFHTINPGQLVAGLKRLGFTEVHEAAAGVEMIAGSYAKAMEESSIPLISSHCPAVVDLIERHFPRLVRNLVPSVSPMIAMGRFLKQRRGDVRIVYVSSCIAAKFERQAPETAGAVDVVLTYRELAALLRNRGLNLALLPDDCFDGPLPHLGRLFPISEGTFKAFSVMTNPLDTNIISAAGEGNVMGLIRDLAAGRIAPHIADLRFCAGNCVGGPGTDMTLTAYYKRNLVISHFRATSPYRTRPEYRQPPQPGLFTRTFSDRSVTLPTPRGGEIKEILRTTNKFTRADELNCRACGYATCREYAVAVYQGLAEMGMCLPYSLQSLTEDHGRLIRTYELARRELEREYADDAIVGNDRHTREVLGLIKQVGPTPTTVLIRGESGTGKELTARAIHRSSLRSDKPLVTLNCTTLSDSLLESELFGHRKGSFTGAHADKIGLFEAADGGTIFLDEIGDITPKLQAELLRVLDTGEVRPVGGTSARQVDVRLIAATNKNLDQGVREGWFREDLFYRLNVFTITMPPLRNRIESIPILAHAFLEKTRTKLNKNITAIEERAVGALQRYPWPGNIRELQNVIERAAVLSPDGIIRLEQLPSVFADRPLEEVVGAGGDFGNERERHLAQVERRLIERYLAETAGNVSKAALLANIPRRTFYRLLDKYGLKGSSRGTS